MSDLVERLRKGGRCEAGCHVNICVCDLCEEAADEIEHLNGELGQVREILTDRENEITRLRAALEYYASGIAGRGDIARNVLKDKP